MLDKVEMLERLSAMWKAGTLNDEEFQNEKWKLLSDVAEVQPEGRAVEEAPDRFGLGGPVEKVNPKRLAMFAAGAVACVVSVIATSELMSDRSQPLSSDSEQVRAMKAAYAEGKSSGDITKECTAAMAVSVLYTGLGSEDAEDRANGEYWDNVGEDCFKRLGGAAGS